MTRRARVEIRGIRPETLLKRLAAEQIRVFDARTAGERMTFQCPLADAGRVSELAQALGYSHSAPRPVGIARGLAWARRRLVLPVCLLLAAAAVALMMTRVWFVNVSDAGEYAGEIRLALNEMGVRPPIKKSEIDARALKEALEWRLPKVRWAQVSVTGVTLKVALVRGVSPDAGGQAPGDIVAKTGGVVRTVLTYAGTPAVNPGEVVRAGQVLIKGEERGWDGSTYPVAARAEVLSSVYRRASAVLPLSERISIPTGRTAAARLIATPFFACRISDTPAFLTFDTERAVTPIVGAFIPISLIRERYIEVALEDGTRAVEDVKREAAALALRRLQPLVFHDEIIDKWVDYSMISSDRVQATATAEVLTDIGTFRPEGGEGDAPAEP